MSGALKPALRRVRAHGHAPRGPPRRPRLCQPPRRWLHVNGGLRAPCGWRKCRDQPHRCVVQRSGDPAAEGGLVGKVVLTRPVNKSTADSGMDVDGIRTGGDDVGERHGLDQPARAATVSPSVRCALCALACVPWPRRRARDAADASPVAAGGRCDWFAAGDMERVGWLRHLATAAAFTHSNPGFALCIWLRDVGVCAFALGVPCGPGADGWTGGSAGGSAASVSR